MWANLVMAAGRNDDQLRTRDNSFENCLVGRGVYNYLETLEQAAAGPSTVLPLEQQVQSLKQEVFELEVLNRHIKQENERLKE